MKIRARFSAYLLAASTAATSLVAPSARAQDDAATEMARERFQEGVKYFDAKQYAKARASFLQAYALKAHPAVLLNLAQSELRVPGYEHDAAKHFAQYMRESDPAAAQERQEAQKGLDAAKQKVHEVTVSVDTDDADVYVNNEAVGKSPLSQPLYLKPGSYTLEARKGGKTANASVTASAGGSTSAALNFNPEAPPAGAVVPPPAGGTTTPPAGSNGPAGGGNVGFDTSAPREGFFEWAKGSPVAWVGGGLTVLGLGLGVGFAVASNSSYSDADETKALILNQANQDGITAPCVVGPSRPSNGQDYARACKQYDDQVSTGDSNKTISIVGFVLAGAAVAGTVVYYFVDTQPKASGSRKPPQRARAQVMPLLGPDLKGLGVVGSF